MGASLIVRQHAYVPVAEMQKWVTAQMSEDAYEHGNSYSGYWNMSHGVTVMRPGHVFESVQAAHDYIADEQEKWGPLFAVVALKELPLTEEDRKADAQYQAAWAQFKELETLIFRQNSEIVRRAKEGKTKLRGCGHCESKVNVTYVNSTDCPVCRQNLLRTATDDKQKAAWQSKIDSLRKKMLDREAAMRKKKYKTDQPTEKVWVVGGWCAS